MTDTRELQRQFLSRVAARLDAGREEYGDQSLDRPIDATKQEILEEIEDICGWSFALWCRAQAQIARLERRVEGNPVRD